MMKKHFLTIVFILLCFSYSNSQSVHFGVKAGLNYSRLSVDSVTSNSSLAGFVGGAYLQIKVAKFFIQPELLFATKGGKSTLDLGMGGVFTQKTNLYYVELPVLFGMKFAKVLRVNVGPSFNYLITSKQETEYNGSPWTLGPSTEWNPSSVGIVAGIGIDIWKLNIDFRYDGSISPIAKNNASTYTDESKVRSNVFQFTLGYRIK